MAKKNPRYDVTMTLTNVYITFPVRASSLENAIVLGKSIDLNNALIAALKDVNGCIDYDKKTIISVSTNE